MQAAARDYGLRFTLFRDDPLPSFNDTMMLFHSAVMVVASHGAGLSNVLFCQPGTYVIEVMPNSFITPFCYLQLTHILGHHWHGIPAVGQGSHITRVSINGLNDVVRKYLQLFQNRQDRQ
jgi:capsular polysaccharide biosynthesis protein